MNVLDEFTREALAMRVGRSSDTDTVVAVSRTSFASTARPSTLGWKTAPELIAWALRDWCRLSGRRTIYIEPGSPWENPYVESFNGRARDELLNVEEFGTLVEAQVIIETWRTEYNTYRSHGSLGGLTPAEARTAWITRHQPALS